MSSLWRPLTDQCYHKGRCRKSIHGKQFSLEDMNESPGDLTKRISRFQQKFHGLFWKMSRFLACTSRLTDLDDIWHECSSKDNKENSQEITPTCNKTRKPMADGDVMMWGVRDELQQYTRIKLYFPLAIASPWIILIILLLLSVNLWKIADQLISVMGCFLTNQTSKTRVLNIA